MSNIKNESDWLDILVYVAHCLRRFCSLSYLQVDVHCVFLFFFSFSLLMCLHLSTVSFLRMAWIVLSVSGCGPACSLASLG